MARAQFDVDDSTVEKLPVELGPRYEGVRSSVSAKRHSKFGAMYVGVLLGGLLPKTHTADHRELYQRVMLHLTCTIDLDNC